MARKSIAVVLALTIVALASNAGAKRQSGIIPIGEIQTDDSSHPVTDLDDTEDRERENFSDTMSTPFSHRTPPVRRSVSTPTVPEGYIYTPDIGVHKLHTHAKSWADARKVCRREGGDLTIINSPKEAEVIKNLGFSSQSHVDSDDTNYVFIGFTDAGKDRARIVTDGRTLEQAGFADWEMGEPKDISGIQTCGTLAKNGKLNDKACWERLAFVCEFPVPNEVLIPGTTKPRRPVTVDELRQKGYKSTPDIGIHKLHTERKTWFQARSICRDEGGDLVILNSPEEAQVVANLINLAGLHSALVGVDDINREGHFVTVDRIPLEEAGFAGWVKDEPSHGSDRWDEDCGSLQHMGLLNDVSCWSPEAFVCELTSLDDEPTSVTNVMDSYTCTPGIGTHKIYRHAEAWQDARNICKEDGGDLAVINSEAEAQVLVELMAKSHPHFDSDDLNYVLIGFDDIHHNGKYVTVDGKSLKEAGYEKWARGEPNNGKGSIEDCGSMFKDGRLNDMPCWKKCGFVCELNISLEDDRTGRTEGNAGIPDPTVGNGNGAQGSRGIEGVTILFTCSLYLLVSRTYF